MLESAEIRKIVSGMSVDEKVDKIDEIVNGAQQKEASG
jgi:hypothetical protein